MNDLISKSKLIEEILEEANTKILGLESGISLGEMKEWVDNQPTVESPTWIPCSERLPTEKEAWDYNADENLYEPNEFIVQVKGAKLPTVAMFDGETFTHGYAEDGYGFMDEIIAWQPLPEPYKGEQHEIN